MTGGRAFCVIKASEKFEAIDEVIASCPVLSSLPADYVKAVHRREDLQSTDIGHGVAIAHGKVAHLEKVRIALGFSERGVVFKHGPVEPVRLLFVIASDPLKESQYVTALSAILWWVHDPAFRALLINKQWDDERVSRFLAMLETQDFTGKYR